jgi:PAS domain S-box-containing protein
MAWSISPDGTPDFVNKQWKDYTGISKEEQMKNPNQPIHPEDLPHVVTNWEKSLAAGKLVEDEMRVRRADGEYRWFLTRTHPLRDDKGNIIKWYGVAIDIEDSKRAEDALRQSEDRIRLIIDTIPTMAWSMRPDGTVDFLNQRWLDYSGLSLEQYIKDPTGPIHPDDIPRVMEKWLMNKTAEKAYDDEMRLRRADGEYRWFMVRTAPLHDEQGKLVNWYGVSIDIENSKRAEDELRLAYQRLSLSS